MNSKVLIALQVFAISRNLTDLTFNEVWDKFTNFVKNGVKRSPTKEDYLDISEWILYDASVDIRNGFSYGFIDKIIAKYHRIK